jgi:DNA-binding IclR family transcriptional regulator
MTDGAGPDGGVKTALRMFDIVEQIRESDGAGVTELAGELGLAKSTVHRYVTTMERAGYLTRTGDTYYLGLQFLDHGIYRREQIVPWDVVSPALKQLAAETSEIAWFTVEEHGRARDIYKSEGDRAVTVETWIGQAKPIHALAAGKAILAQLDESTVREIIDTHGLVRLTDRTIVSADALFEELERIREQGVAYNDEEYTRGIRSVAAPVTHDGRVVGAVNVSGPANRMKGDLFRQELPDQVLAAANETELRMQSAL